jgi:RND family efflux transporter MFP subunit
LRTLQLILLSSLYLFGQDSITGIVNPIYDGKLSVSTDGIISKLLLKEGDTVKKGQVILTLDNKLQKLETIRRKLVLDDTTQVDSLKKSLIIMKDIVSKKEEFFKRTKALSLNELNQLRIQYINAQGELDALISNERKEKIEYQIAKEVLHYYNLKSPIDGVITRIKPKVGEWVQVGSEIVSIVNSKTCYVEVDIDTTLLKNLTLHSKVIVEVKDGLQNIQKEGSVDFISVVADSSSSLVRAKIYFDNSDSAVTPGVTAVIIF